MSSDSSSNDELVSQFLAFTGSSDTQRAAMYLEMSGGHLETAVGLFLEHGSSGGAASSSGPSGGGASSGGGGGGGRLYGGYGFGAHDEVRAPDATESMRLIDDAPLAGMGMIGAGNPYMAIGINQIAATTAFASEVVNAPADDDEDDAMDDGGGGDDDDDETNFDEEDDDNADEGTADATSENRRRQRRSSDRKRSAKNRKNRTTGLADMFAPPVHLICNAGGFEAARANAKDNKRWLLVNLQRDSEFSCHALNRDVWRDELVENLIGEGFIFWQEMDTTPEGRQYADRYKVYDYPHVGIIDPRTRRLMWKKEGWSQQNPLTAEQFAEYAMDFCSRHSFDRPPQAPRPPGAAAKGLVGAGGRPAKRAMHEMSEEEQLQAAMRASLQDSGAGNEDSDYEYEMDENEDDDQDDVVVVDSFGQKLPDADSKPKAVETKPEEFTPAAAPAAAAAAPPPPPPAPASMLDGLLSFDLGAEPEKGARIQFRMPDGKRKIRKFDSSHSVKHVYAFVAQSNPECKDGKEFTLQAGFPPKDLIGDIENSIQGCSLAGEAITVRWK
mmetsp:Transcript_8153/g.24109  ORF Transcript_8153/g.24109 Transcript_8153/m.24109 type:complete len:555 (+) Transcript_8153:331-1995(+)